MWEGDKISWQPVRRLITSGNIISVRNALTIGGFNEELFIDEVDYDFCYRGTEKNFTIFECTEGIYLRHSVGANLKKQILGHTFHSMNHVPIRKYYIVRNRLMVYERYHHLDKKWFLRGYIVSTIKYILKVILFEQQKFVKLKFCFYGIRDFFNHKTGKYTD